MNVFSSGFKQTPASSVVLRPRFGASIRGASPANPIAMMLERHPQSSLIVQLLTSLVLFAC